ncbi:MAG: hypothetical protein M1840_006136 [Geoglossum simile]|nr:MAG: hypothetical protein M1840_006136 [Geoglossum simile]
MGRKIDATARFFSFGGSPRRHTDSQGRGVYYAQGPPKLPPAIEYVPSQLEQLGTSSRATEVDETYKQWLNTESPTVENGSPSAVMSRIYHLLCKARIDFPSTHFDQEIPPSSPGIEVALVDLIRAYGSVYRDYRSLEGALTTEMADHELLQAKCRSLEDKISSLGKDIEKEGIKIALLREEQATREKRVAADHRHQLQEHRKSAEEEKASMKNRLDKEMVSMKNRLERDLIQSHESHKATIERYEMLRGEMREKHEEEKAALGRQIEDATASFRGKLGNAQDKYNEEMEKMYKEIEDIIKEHEDEKTRMRALHADEKIRLEYKREQDSKDLRNEVEVLKGALVKRDHFKALSDNELAHRFQDISSEIDEFARVRWDNGLEPTWPFPDASFRNSRNERRTKKYIVQNVIWVILYEKIFCTPFRVLGSKGKSLEQEWMGMYGQDRKSTGLYPKPTKPSEKWRYETMKEAYEAVSQPLQKWDPGYGVKQGYELSMKEIIEDISRELGRVAFVDEKDNPRISDLARKAAKLWLEVGQQRCRIFLLMSSSGEKPLRSDKSSLDRDRAQELVVVPELRRMGNAQGERLEKDELVSGCKGEFSVFSAGP